MTSDPLLHPRTPEQPSAEENNRTLISPGLNTSTAGAGAGQPTSTSATASQKSRLGRYEIRQFLGSGGMGVVCLGHDTVIERDVAIKILPDAIANDPEIKARFVAEARAAGKLTHPHTVGIYEIGEDEGTNYLVMEYVGGGNLADEISKRGALPVLEATRLMADATRGVAAAHAAGLIHRDIKPANLLRSTGGVVKVADFGLAKGGVHDLQLTQAGRVVGTPYYMSPEQCQSRPVDARSDVYSLGATYFSLLTGQSPYQSAGSSMQVMYAHCHSAPPNPRSINPSVPDACAAIVQKATAKLPEDRYQSADELLADLEAVIATLSGAGQIFLPSGAGSRLGLPATPVASPARGVPTAWLLTASACVVLLAAGLWLHRMRGDGAAAGVNGAANAGAAVVAPTGLPLRVGVLHSLSGTMATSESPVVDAVQLAIGEINAAGGLLGRPVEAVVADGQSDEEVFAREARRLIENEGLGTIFGCWTSASRKRVVPLIEEAGHLLIYPLQYEGLEESPQVFYTGAAPNQQILPAVTWAARDLKKTRFFHVGSDYVFPRAAGEIIKDHLKGLGGELVGEAWLPLGTAEVQEVVAQIVASKPDVLLNTINGDTNVAFFRALRKAGVTSEAMPTISFSVGEEELRHLRVGDMVGDYAAWDYFQSIDTPENAAFLEAFRGRFGAQRLVTDPMEAAYIGVKLWAQAVREAGSDAPNEIRRTLRNQRLSAPEGPVRVDPATQHLIRSARIGRIQADGQFTIVWTSPEPVIPQPFPATRTTVEWRGFLTDLQNGWDGKWSAPSER